MKRPSFFPLLAAAVLAAALSGCAPAAPDLSAVDVSYADPNADPRPFAEGAYAADREDLAGRGAERVRAAIVPHHLVSPAAIALPIRMLGAAKPERIVLLSPDHFHACPAHLCVTRGTFATAFGEVRTDEDGVGAVAASPAAALEPELFKKEHGVHAVLPFIARYAPGTPVVPVVLSVKEFWNADRGEIASVFRGLLSQTGTALVVSSDFSHYLPLSRADAADRRTMATFLAGDLDGIVKLHNADQSDCPGCLWVLADAAIAGGYFHPSVLLHTNSARLLGDGAVRQTTSHFGVVLYADDAVPADRPAFAGDVTFARTGTRAIALSPEARAFWEGPGARVVNLEGPVADACEPLPNPYLFCNPAQAVRANADLATLWGVENNHMLDRGVGGFARTLAAIEDAGETPIPTDGVTTDAVRVFALTTVMNPVPDAHRADIDGMAENVLRLLREHPDERLTAVVIHAGDEFSALTSDVERAFFRSFIDAGADAVLVMHSHVPGDMEIYRERPIFRGLGNFVFDQQERTETQTARLVRLKKQGKRTLFESVLVR